MNELMDLFNPWAGVPLRWQFILRPFFWVVRKVCPLSMRKQARDEWLAVNKVNPISKIGFATWCWIINEET